MTLTPKRVDEIEKWLLLDNFVDKQYIQWPTRGERAELCTLARRGMECDNTHSSAKVTVRKEENAAGRDGAASTDGPRPKGNASNPVPAAPDIKDCICADPENCTEPVPGYRCRKRRAAPSAPPGGMPETMPKYPVLQPSTNVLKEDYDKLRAHAERLQAEAERILSLYRELVDLSYRATHIASWWAVPQRLRRELLEKSEDGRLVLQSLDAAFDAIKDKP